MGGSFKVADRFSKACWSVVIFMVCILSGIFGGIILSPYFESLLVLRMLTVSPVASHSKASFWCFQHVYSKPPLLSVCLF